jgi:hypothetical protein
MNNQFKASTQIWKVAGVTLLVSGLQLHGQETASFTTFDPTGSISTQPQAINQAGAITGYYQEFVGQSAPRAFLRDRYGNVITFDYPNTSQGTFGDAINTAGTITGTYFANNQYHGFLRARNGTFHTFDPPGSTNTTQPQAINRAGAITGYFYDTNGIAHGFLRKATPGEF